MRGVPFSSIFFCSNPLAAGLTRRRLQAFFLILGLLHLPQFYEFARWKEFTVLKSQSFRFTLFDTDFLDQTHIRQISLGLTLDGMVIETMEKQHALSESMVFNFTSAHVWNGWFFEISPDQGGRTKFSLHSMVNGAWRQVGSSSFAQVADTTVFFDGLYHASPGRNHFQLSSPGYWGFWVNRLLGGVSSLGLAVSGAMRRCRTGSSFCCNVFFTTSTVIQLVEAYSTRAVNGNHSYIVCLVLAVIYVGAIYLALMQGRWIDAFMWEGLCIAAAGAAVYPYGEDGRRSALFAWGIAGPFLVLSFGVRFSYIFVRWASRRAIAPDARRHAELWAEALASDPGSRSALREIEALLSDLAAGAGVRDPPNPGRLPSAESDAPPLRCGSADRPVPAATALEVFSRSMSSVLDVADPPPPDDGPWCTVIGGPTACRQPLPPPPASTAGNSAAGWLLGLVGCEEYPVLADLGRLYAQAAAAEPVLRGLVFGWARASGGYLPFRPAGSWPEAEGGGGSGEKQGRKGELRLVEEGDTEGDVVWPELKRMERSIEKARRRSPAR